MGFANSTLRSLPFGQVIGAPLIAAVRAQALAAQATVDFIKNVGFMPADAADPADFGNVRYVVFRYKRLKPGMGSSPTGAPSGSTATSGSGGAGSSSGSDAGAGAGSGTPSGTGTGGATTPATTDSRVELIELEVPILTIVPVPYLRLDEVKLNFTANITEQHTSTTSNSTAVATDTSLDVGYSSFFTPVKVGFNAKVSTRHNSNSTTSSRNRVEYTMDINVRAVQDEIPAGLGRVLGILEEAMLQRNA